LVNHAGLADHVYAPLDHAPWNGWTPTDLVFPFFLFAVGMSMAFSFSKYLDGAGGPPPAVYIKVFRRAAILFGLGVLLNGFFKYDFATIRVMGILQRISLCYLAVALVGLRLSPRAQVVLCGTILLGYWAAMTCAPVPGYGAGVLTREGNFGAYVDRLIIPSAHLYRWDSWKNSGDPEGLFSTLTAFVSTMIGYLAGQWVRGRKADSRLSMDMVLAGLVCASIGMVWGWAFPINKRIWTSSYTLFMGGMGLLLFAFCHEICQVRGRRWLEAFEVFGKNPLTVFVGAEISIKLLVVPHLGSGESAPTAYEWINSRLFESWLGPYNGPAFLAVLIVFFWWLSVRWLDQRGWQWKA
jgi:predicted acyltransferase